MTLAYTKYSLYFTMGHKMPPKILFRMKVISRVMQVSLKLTSGRFMAAIQACSLEAMLPVSINMPLMPRESDKQIITKAGKSTFLRFRFKKN